MDTGEAQAAVIVNGDVQGFNSRACAVIGPVAGIAHARPHEAVLLFDVQVDLFAGMLTFVANRRQNLGFEELEPVQPVPSQDSIEDRLGDRPEPQDHG